MEAGAYVPGLAPTTTSQPTTRLLGAQLRLAPFRALCQHPALAHHRVVPLGDRAGGGAAALSGLCGLSGRCPHIGENGKKKGETRREQEIEET